MCDDAEPEQRLRVVVVESLGIAKSLVSFRQATRAEVRHAFHHQCCAMRIVGHAAKVASGIEVSVDCVERQ